MLFDSYDPWAVLGQDTNIEMLTSGQVNMYGMFKMIVLSVLVISLMGSIIVTIYANVMGSSQEFQEAKKGIKDKLLLIAFVSAILFTLTIMKDVIDDFFGFKNRAVYQPNTGHVTVGEVVTYDSNGHPHGAGTSRQERLKSVAVGFNSEQKQYTDWNYLAKEIESTGYSVDEVTKISCGTRSMESDEVKLTYLVTFEDGSACQLVVKDVDTDFYNNSGQGWGIHD